MKKVAIYARCSTKDQNTDLQLLDLRQYAQNAQLNIVEEFVENGVSGMKSDRPRLNELMLKARQRLFDIVLVWKFDRFARSTSHLINTLEEFKKLGIDFISYTQNVNTLTSMGKAMFTLIGTMAELERDLIVERVNAGLRKAREKGKKLGRPSVNVDLEKLNELRNQGYSIRKLAQVFHVTRGTVYNRLKKIEGNNIR